MCFSFFCGSISFLDAKCTMGLINSRSSLSIAMWLESLQPQFISPPRWHITRKTLFQHTNSGVIIMLIPSNKWWIMIVSNWIQTHQQFAQQFAHRFRSHTLGAQLHLISGYILAVVSWDIPIHLGCTHGYPPCNQAWQWNIPHLIRSFSQLKKHPFGSGTLQPAIFPLKKPTAPPDSWHLPKVTPVPELTAALPDRYGRYGLAPEMLVVAGEKPYKIGSLTVANGEMIMWQSMPETHRNTRIWLGIGPTLKFHWDWDLTDDKPHWTNHSFTCTTDMGNVWSEILRMRTWSLLAYGWIALGSCPQDLWDQRNLLNFSLVAIYKWCPQTIVKVAGKKLQYRLTMVN